MTNFKIKKLFPVMKLGSLDNRRTCRTQWPQKVRIPTY